MADERKDRDLYGSTGNPATPGATGTGSDAFSTNPDPGYTPSETGDTTLGSDVNLPNNTKPGFSSGTQSKTSQAMDKVQSQAQPVMDQAKQQAGQVADQAQQKAKGMLQEQKGMAADQLSNVAHALHEAGDSLDQNNTPFGQYAHQAASTVDHLAQDLRSKSVDDLFYGAEQFARREPQVFLGGAMIAGILLARFLKSAMPQQDFGGQGFSGNYGNTSNYNRGTTRNYRQAGYAQTFDRGQSDESFRPRRMRGTEPFEEGYSETWTGEEFYPTSGSGQIE